MPQIVSYRVAVGTRRGGTLVTNTIECRVPDIVTCGQAERQLYEKIVGEWHTSLQSGKPFEVDRIAQISGRGWHPVPEPSGGNGRTEVWGLGFAGLIAVHPDEIAWLQVAAVEIRPEGEPA